MHNKIAVLALVALLQLVVIAWFWFGSDAKPQNPKTPSLILILKQSIQLYSG